MRLTHWGIYEACEQNFTPPRCKNERRLVFRISRDILRIGMRFNGEFNTFAILEVYSSFDNIGIFETFFRGRNARNLDYLWEFLKEKGEQNEDLQS
jgi:hypothetical protein